METVLPDDFTPWTSEAYIPRGEGGWP